MNPVNPDIIIIPKVTRAIPLHRIDLSIKNSIILAVLEEKNKNIFAIGTKMRHNNRDNLKDARFLSSQPSSSSSVITRGVL